VLYNSVAEMKGVEILTSSVMTVGLNGMDGYRVKVEVNTRTDKESFVIVGLPDALIPVPVTPRYLSKIDRLLDS
jgi:hypothetical protein